MARVGREIDVRSAGWTFEGIAGQFDDHVRLSVPLYDEGYELACRLGDFFLPQGGTVVELGAARRSGAWHPAGADTRGAAQSVARARPTSPRSVAVSVTR